MGLAGLQGPLARPDTLLTLRQIRLFRVEKTSDASRRFLNLSLALDSIIRFESDLSLSK